MAESILKLKVDSTEYDSKIKRAAQGLQAYAEGCRKVGDTLEVVEKDTLAYVKALGKMETTSKGTKSSLNEMTNAFTDLSMEYKKLTDQEKASPFGKALSASLDQLKGRIQQTKNDFNEITNQISGGGVAGKAGGLFGGGKLDGMLQVFGGNLMTKAAGWAASFAVDLGECVNQGIELAKQSEGVRLAFERLNRPGLLDNLNEATHGTVTNLELMKAAVKFDDFKLPVEELGTMLAFAQKKAKDTGQSIDYMVDSIVTGLGRKSLMILDNLGLSAAEIKEKMKETGDMTKAVGEIIREQMAKAGEYVETSADKAAQADKRLKDAMEELGRTFQPLTDAGNTMWSDLKVGALNLLNSAVRPLIDAFTELGRVRSQYASQGGDARVNRQLGVLSGIHTKQYQKNTYNAQLRNYDTKIGSYEQYLTDYKKWQSDKTAVGAYDRMQAFQKQTGLSMYSDVKEQLEVFKKMRAEYVSGAQSIINENPAPSPTSPTKTTTTPTGKNTPTYQAGSLAEAQAEVQRLTKLWNEAGEGVRNQYLQPLVEAEQKVKAMQNAMALQKEQAQGKLLGGNVQTTGLEGQQFKGLVDANMEIGKGVDMLTPLENKLKELVELQNTLGRTSAETWQKYQVEIEKTTKQIDTFKGKNLTGDAKLVKGSFKEAAGAVGNLGSALNGLDDPAAKIAGTVAQAIANIALAFSSADLKDGETGNVWYWIATTAAGLSAMITTISSIKAATNYAEGGMIKGNSYSGDNIMAMGSNGSLIGLNAGEIVLNRAQQFSIAGQLSQQNGGGSRVVGVLKGEDIVLMADRWGMRTGRGELLFGKNL